MRIKKPSPTRGRRHGGAVTDEGAANLIRPLSQPSAASSPARGAFGVCKYRRPMQKGADQQIRPAPSIDGRCSTVTSRKFGTPYQAAHGKTYIG